MRSFTIDGQFNFLIVKSDRMMPPKGDGSIAEDPGAYPTKHIFPILNIIVRFVSQICVKILQICKK
jgi:hypothetical protein